MGKSGCPVAIYVVFPEKVFLVQSIKMMMMYKNSGVKVN